MKTTAGKTNSVRLVLIAAMGRNRVLSADGTIPWRLPRDTAHFRARAAGRWLLLGRRTFEQMRGWFQPGQVPLVLTSDESLSVPGGRVCHSVEEAIRLAEAHGMEELLVCGGGSVYAATLPMAAKVILTTVEAELEGDVFFPELPAGGWRLSVETRFPPDPLNPLAMRITHWKALSGD
ncbi:MAG: dihydrofolate reductase [Verrucomicrobiota bacterium]